MINDSIDRRIDIQWNQLLSFLEFFFFRLNFERYFTVEVTVRYGSPIESSYISR